MTIIIECILKTIRNLHEKSAWGIIVISIILNTAFFFLLLATVWIWLDNSVIFSIGILEWISDSIGKFLAMTLTWFLYPLLLPIVLIFFLETFAVKFAKKIYPNFPAPKTKSLLDLFTSSLSFVIISILLNILVCPLYFIPIINLITYYCLNGYLLGREYFEIVAQQYYENKKVKKIVSENKKIIILSGIIILLISTIPVLQFLVGPFIIIFMVHLLVKLS